MSYRFLPKWRLTNEYVGVDPLQVPCLELLGEHGLNLDRIPRQSVGRVGQHARHIASQDECRRLFWSIKPSKRVLRYGNLICVS